MLPIIFYDNYHTIRNARKGTYLLFLALCLCSKMQNTTITTTRHTMMPNMNPARPEIPITLGSDCIMSTPPSDLSLCGPSDEDGTVEDIKDMNDIITLFPTNRTTSRA